MADDVVKKSEARSAKRGEMAAPGAGRPGEKGGQGIESISDAGIEREKESGHAGESSKKSARWEGT